MEQQVITIVGGTGFVGRYVVKQLAAAGYTIRVISRHPDGALYLKTAGDVGQIVLIGGDIARPETLEGKLAGSYAVINLAGILFESGAQTFDAVHAQGAEKLAQLAGKAGAQRFIHVSALGSDRNMRSHYARSKLAGENAVLAAFPGASILRPSVIFGPEDGFFNKFAALACLTPFLPLIGGGRTRFQPVYVGDVARAIVACIANPETMGHVYELGGPHSYSFRQILEYILQTIGRRRKLIAIPFGLASLKARFLELLPRPLLTRDQVRLLRTDNVVGPKSLKFADLGLSPMAMEMIVPEYLARFRKKASV